MSSDTGKENASVVDSSVTDWKHDMGNSDDLESPSYKGNVDGYTRSVNARHHMVGNQSVSIKGRLYDTRYFIIKSLNHHNLQLSVDKGIWATQVMNEPILEEAFHNSGKVILIFSVNMSGFFQGYAQMMSSIGLRHDHIWSQGNGKSNSWGRSFEVKWLQLNDLPFQRTLHLKNPLNEYKPVKISRDCQELPVDIGEALCKLIDGDSDFDGPLNSFSRDDHHLKEPFTEAPYTSGDGEYYGTQIHVPWGRTPMPYPSLLYHHPADASRFHLADPGSMRIGMPGNQHLTCSPSKGARTASFHADGNTINPLVQHEGTSQMDFWRLSAESPRASSLTDDDLLDMTYEQYLEIHSRNIKLNPRADGKSQSTCEKSRSKRSKDASSLSDRNPNRTTHERSKSKRSGDDFSRDQSPNSMAHETSRSKRRDNESNSTDHSQSQATHETASRRKRNDDHDLRSSGQNRTHKRRHHSHHDK